jgi:hypothetical protein
MKLRRCREQTGTVEEFFHSHLRPDGHGPDCRAMLELVKSLQDHQDSFMAWGLTSHFDLILLSKDESDGCGLVVVNGEGSRERTHRYEISYAIPQEVEPWPHARVIGRTESIDAAIKMILTAMVRSRGWAANGMPLGR